MQKGSPGGEGVNFQENGFPFSGETLWGAEEGRKEKRKGFVKAIKIDFEESCFFLSLFFRSYKQAEAG